MAINSEMKNITINPKSNGIILTMKLDTLLEQNKIFAWQANSGWFYLTLYETKGDSTKLLPETIPKEIRKFQIIENKESLQIGIRLNEPIQNYEFRYNKDNNTITSNLHYSIEYFSKIDNILKNQQPKLEKSPKRYISNWLYKTSLVITFLGLIDNPYTINNTSKLGIGVFISALVLDIFIEP